MFLFFILQLHKCNVIINQPNSDPHVPLCLLFCLLLYNTLTFFCLILFCCWFLCSIIYKHCETMAMVINGRVTNELIWWQKWGQLVLNHIAIKHDLLEHIDANWVHGGSWLNIMKEWEFGEEIIMHDYFYENIIYNHQQFCHHCMMRCYLLIWNVTYVNGCDGYFV